MGHLPPIRSKQEDWTANGTVEFEGWVPPRMGSTGRAVIKGFWVRIFGSITVAGAAWDGRAVPRLIQHLAVESRSAGRRWSLSGEKTRAAAIMFAGIHRHIEHANVAIGAAQAVDAFVYVPMEKPFVFRGADFGMGAETFSKIVVQWNSLAGAADSGGAVLSDPSLDAYVLADLRDENSAEIKAEDIVQSLDFGSQTQIQSKFSGALHDAFIYRETGAAGGAAITGIGTVRSDELGIPVSARADLVRWYKAKRGYGNTGTSSVGAERFKDPFIDGQALPIVIADEETSLWDGRVVTSAKFDLDAGAANLSLVTRETLAKSEANFNAQVAALGLDPRQMRMKTAGKTRRAFSENSERKLKVGVWSAPLPGYVEP